MSSDWLGLLLVGLPMLFAVLAWYVRVVIRQSTETIRVRNGGSNLADLPARMDRVELDSRRQTEMLIELSVNQMSIMRHMGACKEVRFNANPGG